jgi:hypothetical protein
MRTHWKLDGNILRKWNKPKKIQTQSGVDAMQAQHPGQEYWPKSIFLPGKPA